MHIPGIMRIYNFFIERVDSCCIGITILSDGHFWFNRYWNKKKNRMLYVGINNMYRYRIIVSFKKYIVKYIYRNPVNGYISAILCQLSFHTAATTIKYYMTMSMTPSDHFLYFLFGTRLLFLSTTYYCM